MKQQVEITTKLARGMEPWQEWRGAMVMMLDWAFIYIQLIRK